MNQRVAKALRKEVYGDFSLREPRRYVVDAHGTIRVLGRRALYQEIKKKRRNRHGNDPGM